MASEQAQNEKDVNEAALDRVPGASIPIWGSYLRQLQQRPTRTKLLTSVWVMSVAHLTGQLVQRGKVTDTKSIRIWGLWGLLLASFHTWYQPMMAKHGPKSTVLKIMLDHVIHKVPILYLFATYDQLMRGASWLAAWKHSVAVNATVQLASLKVWPLIQILNFTVMPLPLRVLYQNVALFVWVVYLSIKMRVQ
mmetsp:Transcript_43649/g.100705  ORF Transcript_43649/g.100705 Transcript_43649/m.100705 type:complete len:193 (+) Transcript_43649:56-634(+)